MENITHFGGNITYQNSLIHFAAVKVEHQVYPGTFYCGFLVVDDVEFGLFRVPEEVLASVEGPNRDYPPPAAFIPDRDGRVAGPPNNHPVATDGVDAAEAAAAAAAAEAEVPAAHVDNGNS